ncbi:hypothetical protein [Mitsuaria sp. GD03876]|uniref:hypothetical protein n=1 Tax=Mitsuaria sp. GD03876 TaxID=2975399 RepID=UPI00244BDA14|nr:hypothetical protein [Mitsuaria sp. GD03876]MDH0863366.1 hypothetical protein [Mitsuaria sp. GD03876]
MMTPAQQIAAFIAHVTDSTDKFTESRSSLRNLLAWLRTPTNQATRLADVAAAKRHCADPNDRRLAKYDPALRSLVVVWGTSNDYARTPPAPVATVAAAPVGGSVMALINAARVTLEQCRNYACNDVGTFPQCVNTALPKSRQDAIRERGALKTGMPLLVDPTAAWNAPALEQAFMNVNRNRAGECTAYAYYAGHVLGTTPMRTARPRLEIVSWEGKGMAKHCFVVVGRAGPRGRSGLLPNSVEWNTDARIVDCWALTLGFECVYSVSNYCYPGMINPAQIIMDSTVARVARPFNSQGGLAKTEHKLW